MKHPILSGSGYKLYILIWIVIIVIHSGVLYFYYDFPLEVALSDGLIYNFIYGSLVPGFWFIVTFSNLKTDQLSILITHSGAAFLTTALWLWSSWYLLSFLFLDDLSYVEFLQESQIWRGILGVLFYSVSVLIFYLIKYYQDMQTRLNRELELQNLLKDSELRMLKSQINPHFIFNSLNSVSALTVANPETARNMVIKLSDFLRYSLGKELNELNSLEQEIKNASLYLDIEKVRFGDRLIFLSDVSDECLDVQVPNLILQPLVENAVKHGLYETLEPIKIVLSCKKNDDMIEIRLTNDCDPSTTARKGSGIGLKNVKRRLSLVYGSGTLLEVTKEKNTFTVTLNIPESI